MVDLILFYYSVKAANPMDLNNTISLIKNSRHDLLEELWLDLHDLIAWYAGRYYVRLTAGGQCFGITVDDLIQSGFIALYEAVYAYDPQREDAAFKALLQCYLHKQFRLTIGRTDRQLRDPLNHCKRLEEPIDSTDPGGLLLEDVIPDDNNGFEAVEDEVYRNQLHDALEDAIDMLPKGEAACLRSQYWEELSQAETADKMGVTVQRVSQLHNAGLNHIRRSSARSKLEQFLDDNTNYYQLVGKERFNRTHSSSVETIVLKREFLREWYAAHMEEIDTEEDASEYKKTQYRQLYCEITA